MAQKEKVRYKFLKEIIKNLFLGDEYDCHSVWTNDWSVVHACKFPCFNKVKKHGLLFIDGNHLYLNLVDTNNDYEVPLGLFTTAIQFIDKEIKRGQKVLVHCNMAISRSPTIILLYLAMIDKSINNIDHYEAIKEFMGKYCSRYRPSATIYHMLENKWEVLKHYG